MIALVVVFNYEKIFFPTYITFRGEDYTEVILQVHDYYKKTNAIKFQIVSNRKITDSTSK